MSGRFAMTRQGPMHVLHDVCEPFHSGAHGHARQISPTWAEFQADYCASRGTPVGVGVGAIAAHPESPAFGAAVTKIMEAYPYRLLTRSHGVARAGHTIGVNRALAEAIVRTAHSLGAHPYDLANVMNHESGFTFRPDVQSGRKLGDAFDPARATGIIQFLPSTARKLGTTTAALHGMTAAQQMTYVQRYFERVRSGEHTDSFGANPIAGPRNGKLDSLHKVSMAVFFPRALDWKPHKLFPALVARQHATPASYVRNVARTSKLASTSIPRPRPAERLQQGIRTTPPSTAVAAGLVFGLLAIGVAVVVARGS